MHAIYAVYSYLLYAGAAGVGAPYMATAPGLSAAPAYTSIYAPIYFYTYLLLERQ